MTSFIDGNGVVPADARLSTQLQMSDGVSFSSTGEVQVLYVLKGLRNGLTENALDAAAKIQFRPALLDGKPVSQIILLQYNFNLPWALLAVTPNNSFNQSGNSVDFMRET